MLNWKRKLIWASAVIVVLLILPFLIPMSAYIKQAEAQAAKALGVPVSIGSLRIALLPSPRLNVGEVTIGKNSEFSVAHVAVVPALSSLFSDAKVISSVQVDKPVIKKAALDIIAGLSAQPKGEPSKTTVSVRMIEINEARLIWPAMHLPEMNADIVLSAENKPKAAKIESVDGKLKFDLVSEGDLNAGKNQQRITFTAKAWTLPAGPPLLIDALHMDIVLTGNKLEISKIDGALYGGKLSGNANLTWDKAYKLSGKAKLDNLSVREPASLMSKSTRVSGQLFSSGNFSAAAKEPAQLVDNLQADIKFNVNDGVLYGFDLAKAPLMLLGQGKGGETKFDVFSGLLGISGKTYRFRELNIKSGLMSASGAVKINPNKSLDGVIAVEVKNSMKIAEIPLQVSGTLSNPTVFPTKAAIAGAIAGTAVLGPAGTGLGLKAGSAVDKLKGLFGGGK
jgi:uncharacterized protein involved in outer membrane biogenesis